MHRSALNTMCRRSFKYCTSNYTGFIVGMKYVWFNRGKPGLIRF